MISGPIPRSAGTSRGATAICSPGSGAPWTKSIPTPSQPVRGSIVLPSGDLLAVDSSEGGNRRGLNQFDFELTQAAGEVNFRAWPPYSVFVLKLALGRASFPYERILVTRHGLPLLEGAESWFDHSDFPLLDGVPEAVPPADGPWLFLGRATVRNEARQKGTP
jgi:hypothetical protein